LTNFERNFTKRNFYFVTQLISKHNFYFETEGVYDIGTCKAIDAKERRELLFCVYPTNYAIHERDHPVIVDVEKLPRLVVHHFG
jgi:hypothetical protein